MKNHRKTLLTLLLQLLPLMLFSQVRDIDLEQCEYEPDAAGEIIFDKGSTVFIDSNNGFALEYKRHRKIKIFTQAALDEAEISIDLYKGASGMEKVSNIRAITYNKVGDQMVLTELKPANIYQEDVNDSWYRKKFAMPNVKEGSIIEYSYTIVSPYILHLRDWEFQSHIPCRHSELKVRMIPFYSYRFKAQSISSFDKYDSYKASGLDRMFAGIAYRDMTYEFVLNKVKSFTDEDFISSRDDYIKKVEFQLAEINRPNGYHEKYMDTWPKLADELLDNDKFGKYIKKATKDGSKLFAPLVGLNVEQKIDTVLNYVKNQYKLNGYIGKFAREDYKSFIKLKEGNTANINLLALGYMRSLGLNVRPVIISTRSHGKVTDDFPFEDLFNNVLILLDVDGFNRILDATNSFYPNTLIPSDNINGKGFIVQKDSESWAVIKSQGKVVEQATLRYTVSESGKLTGEVYEVVKEYAAAKAYGIYKNNKVQFLEKLTENGVEIIGDVNCRKELDKQKTFEYDYKFESQTTVMDDQIILNPFLDFTINENPFKQKKRSAPVDLIFPRQNGYNVYIDIPEGYKVDYLPKVYSMSNSDFTFNYSVFQNKGKLMITAVYLTKKSHYPAESYENLKAFMDKVLTTLNQNIILVKEDNIQASL